VNFLTDLEEKEASSLEKALTSLSLTEDNGALLNANEMYLEAIANFRGKHK